MNSSSKESGVTHYDERAKVFVEARRSNATVLEYPGKIPDTLAEAYSIQNDAISLWGEEVKGWKVGGINGEWRDRYGETRLMGPIFSGSVQKVYNQSVAMPVFDGGFAAVETEITAIIGRDVPVNKGNFTREDALEFISSLYIGIEIASSPFPGINHYGPLVTISDFGNNNGMILGPEIQDWQKLNLSDWQLETLVNGQSVGKGTPTSAPGGPIESVRAALENTSNRGLPMKTGDIIVTGAVTGIHEVKIGDECAVKFLGEDALSCRVETSSRT
jgi:2-keto-4-pentenoate hydratase